MSTRERILETTVRAGALLLGLSVVAVAVWSWRVPGGTVSPGAEVSIQAQPLGELAISPLEPVVLGRDLQPGAAPGKGDLTIRNQTGADLEVRVRATPTGAELDRLLWVEVRSASDSVFRGPLRDLRRWTDPGFNLSSGGIELLTVSAWVPEEAETGFQGRVENLSFELRPEKVGD